jgi:voltage-gated potassium channel
MIMLMNREQMQFYLTDLRTPLGKAINLTLAALIFVSSGIFVAETYNTSGSIRWQLNFIDNAIYVIFTIEYALRLWSAENKIKYIFSFYSIIDLLAVLPFFLGVVDIRFIRLLRGFQILRLIRFIDKQVLFGHVSSEDGLSFVRILFTLFAIVFVYSGLIYQVEHPVNPEAYSTFLDAFYFSVVTMTTVGFGDLTPISELGRLLTVLMIFTGIALIPWQIGDLIKRVVKTANQVEIVCPGCGLAFHDADAGFCKRCGAKLPQLKLD